MAKVKIAGFSVVLSKDEWETITEFILFHGRGGSNDRRTEEFQVWDAADDILLEVHDLLDLEETQ